MKSAKENKNTDTSATIVPKKVINAVKTIEDWTKKQTSRDDWAIGDIACRRGFERLLKLNKNIK
jgi:hypothetical protein